MKILILGSNGQIGNSLFSYLSYKHEVIAFDIENKKGQDLRKQNILDCILPNVDFVFFLAFDVGGSTYLKKYQDTKEFMDNNMKLMLYTFESLEKCRTPFIFASSQMANMSYSNYGLLKTIGEKYTQILGGLLIKFWNVYGIEKDEKKFHVITDFIKSAKKNNHISIKTSGEEERQFLHTDDCCKCLEILMKNYLDIPRDKNIHITSFEWTRIIEIAKIISSINGCSYEVGVDNDIQQNKKNEADKFILNYWQPKINIKEGIKLVYDNI